MKLSCDTIKDILPLVAENLASEDTEKLVNEHLKDCLKCKKEYEELKTSKKYDESKKDLESIPLKDIKRKLKNRNIYIGVLTALIISLLLFIGFNKATKPIPLSFGEAVESTEIEDGKLFIKFKTKVSNYSIVSSSYDQIDYEIMAWKTNISRLFKKGEAKTTVISIDKEKPILVRYISQDSELDKIIYGKDQEGNSLTLPRLAMNYYLFIMVIIFVISIVLSFIFRNMDKTKKTTNIVMFFPLSYILSHIVIVGVRGSTHHMNRDLSFVIVTTILFFIIFILTIYRKDFINNKNIIRNK